MSTIKKKQPEIIVNDPYADDFCDVNETTSDTSAHMDMVVQPTPEPSGPQEGDHSMTTVFGEMVTTQPVEASSIAVVLDCANIGKTSILSCALYFLAYNIFCCHYAAQVGHVVTAISLPKVY